MFAPKLAAREWESFLLVRGFSFRGKKLWIIQQLSLVVDSPPFFYYYHKVHKFSQQQSKSFLGLLFLSRNFPFFLHTPGFFIFRHEKSAWKASLCLPYHKRTDTDAKGEGKERKKSTRKLYHRLSTEWQQQHRKKAFFPFSILLSLRPVFLECDFFPFNCVVSWQPTQTTEG